MNKNSFLERYNVLKAQHDQLVEFGVSRGWIKESLLGGVFAHFKPAFFRSNEEKTWLLQVKASGLAFDAVLKEKVLLA